MEVADISVLGGIAFINMYVKGKLYAEMHDRYQYACKHSGAHVGSELLLL